MTLKSKFFGLVSLIILTVAVSSCKKIVVGTVLYAQTVPYTATATWDKNPAADNVTNYVMQMDNGPTVNVVPTSCAATCTGQISVPTFGAHAFKVLAQNLRISTDPTSAQSGPATTLNFTLSQAPGAVGNAGIK